MRAHWSVDIELYGRRPSANPNVEISREPHNFGIAADRENKWFCHRATKEARTNLHIVLSCGDTGAVERAIVRFTYIYPSEAVTFT